jgi:valyl-tRNA synthetase
MVKSRRYGDHGAEAAASANATLLCALAVVNRLLAPYLPFVAEEVWSWWQPGSVHAARWPTAAEIDRVAPPDEPARRALDRTIGVLGEVRRQKSLEKRGMKAKIAVAVVAWEREALDAIRTLEADLRTVAGIERFEYREHAGPMEVRLTFAETAAGEATE